MWCHDCFCCTGATVKQFICSTKNEGKLPLDAGLQCPWTLLYIKEACKLGAEYVLVLAPANRVFDIVDRFERVHWRDFFFLPTFLMLCLLSNNKMGSTVSDASPLHILIYSYPDITGGINISSDVIAELARSHKNIVRAKLTCNEVGKLIRIQFSFVAGYIAGFGGKSNFPPYSSHLLVHTEQLLGMQTGGQ